jgi:PPOX class probable F420-dependent enzyme
MPDVPEAYHDLFEKPTVAHLVTMLPDGRPHSTPIWIDYDAGTDRLLVNTERERRKARNVSRDPTVAVSMTDPDDPYRFLSVTGEVESVTTDGAREHIDELAGRYLGESEYPNPVQSERIILRIRPEDVYTSD